MPAVLWMLGTIGIVLLFGILHDTYYIRPTLKAYCKSIDAKLIRIYNTGNYCLKDGKIIEIPK